jgi:malonate-semialdehyde dehydrogenase (acetylating)/methylmalonate-semialdehyde dehydrogenase
MPEATMQVTHIPHWIGGGPRPGDPARAGPVYNPASGVARARVAMADSAVVDEAVRSAAAALPAWRETSLARRSDVLFRFRDLVARHANELACLITGEHGKVLADARGEVKRGLEVAEFACGIPHLLRGRFSENVGTGVDSYSMRQPLGVVAGITPFNFPVMVPMWMFPIAIACGNTFVLKPSEKDPSASLRLAELWKEAGLPDGVFNVVHGGREAVEAILTHSDVRAVSFVGSTPVARAVYEAATRAGKRVQALGGAKNHMVVLPDADMDDAADAAVNAAYGSAGERCMAVSVLMAVGDAADRLVPLLRERLGRIRVGDGLDDASDMGPLVTAEHRGRVAGFVARGLDEGAELVADGRPLRVEGRAGGFFLGPCLFDHVRPSMTIYREEIFGPVLSVVRVPTYEAARDLINAGAFANGVALFTRDGGAARRFQHEIEVGMVGINVPIPVPVAYYSFGGWKSSLFGDTHVYGEEGVAFYTRAKVVTARWGQPHGRAGGRADGKDLGFPGNE